MPAIYNAGDLFGTFDLGRAYSQAENVKASQQNRATDIERTDLFKQKLALETKDEETVAKQRQAYADWRAFKDNPKWRASVAGEARRLHPEWQSASDDELITRMGVELETALGIKGESEPKADRRVVGGRLVEVGEDGTVTELYAAPEKPAGGGTTFVMPSMGEREWQFFQNLSPEDQSRYLELQRKGATPQTAAELASATTTATEQAKATTAAETDLPRIEANSDQMLKTLTDLRAAPGLKYIYGVGSLAPVVPGTAQADAFAIWEQVQGKAFLEAFNTLKGAGQITEKEGEKATAAITRLSNRKQSLDSVMRAIKDLEDVTRAAQTRARTKARRAPAAQSAPPVPAPPPIENKDPLGIR